MKKTLLLILAITTLHILCFGQNKSQVKGRIYEEVNGKKQALPFANIFIEGTTTGTTSQMDGNYTLNIDEGEFTICFSFIGFKTIKRKITSVTGEPPIIINVVLKTDGEQLDEIKVIAKANRESEVGLILNQKQSSIIIENIGASELSRKGASDVASGVKKVTGVSTMGSINLFIRGMGDRYNNAILNGHPIGSPNPDRKVVPLDLFPTSIVKNIGVKKVFSVDNYADFSGGTVNIETKDFLSKPFFKIDISSTYNSITTSKDFKYSRNSDGKANYFGLSKGDRVIPKVAQIANLQNNGKVYLPEVTAPAIAKDPFKTKFGFAQTKAPLELSFNISGGKEWKINEDTKIAGLVSASYKNEYSNRDGQIKQLIKKGDIIYDFDKKSYNFSTNSSALASLSFLTGRQNINLSVLYLNNTNDNLNDYEGYHSTHSQYGNLLQRRITYRKHNLINGQLGGSHPLSERFEIKWKSSFSKANSYEPDRKDMVFVDKNADENITDYYLYTLDDANISRYFQELTEDEYSGHLSLNFKFGKEYKNIITAGFQVRDKQRNFNSRNFNYKSTKLNEIIFDVYEPNTIYFTDQDFASKKVKIEEVANAASEYSAELQIYSSYIDFILNLNKVTLNMGVRAEKATEKVEYRKEGDTWDTPLRVSELNGLDIFPALNLKYSPTEKANFRFSASRTISRPEFKEIAPFPYIEVFGGAETRGNENLQNAYNYNGDLKFELYPNKGELFSVTLFGKYLEDPIEKYTRAGSTFTYSFINTKSAIVAGAELEFKKNFSSFLDETTPLSNIFIGINASYIYTNINLGEKAQTINTNKERALQGASPYLGNIDLNYLIKSGKNNNTTISVIYNLQGKRIYSVGVEGAEDIYEKTLSTLDLLFKGKRGKHLGWKIEAKNILNPSIEKEQKTDKGLMITDIYKKGIDFKVGLSYTF